MHSEAMDYLRRIKAVLPPRRLVVDLGAHNWNGSARVVFHEARTYIGVDLIAGDGVDAVADAATFDPDVEPDTVIASELLEHTPAGAAIIANAYRMLAPGGVVILTAASEGRGPHSAHGGPLQDGEHYANVRYYDLRGWLIQAGFEDIVIEVDDVAHDIRAHARKPDA